MQSSGIEPVFNQRLMQNCNVSFPITEDDRVFDHTCFVAHQFAQNMALCLRIGRGKLEFLGDELRGRSGRADADLLGVAEELFCQLLNFWRHRRREEHGLARWRQKLADALDVGDETHVEHAVCFVDHEVIDRIQQKLSSSEVVEKAAGRRDQNICAAFELLLLIVERHTADQKRYRQLVLRSERFNRFGHLRREFASWLENEGARHTSAGAAFLKHRQKGKNEGSRLARSGLSDADNVSALKGDWNGLGLYGGGGGIACRLDGCQHFFAELQILKSHIPLNFWNHILGVR